MYKRQEYEAEKADLEAKIAEASELIAQLEEEISSNYDLYLQVPVSYTHLDVYKRQLPLAWELPLGR